jgi:hypothetical protein
VARAGDATHGAVVGELQSHGGMVRGQAWGCQRGVAPGRGHGAVPGQQRRLGRGELMR